MSFINRAANHENRGASVGRRSLLVARSDGLPACRRESSKLAAYRYGAIFIGIANVLLQRATKDENAS